MSIFGDIVIGSAVEVAVVDTLKLWLPTYMLEMEDQLGIAPNTLPRPTYFDYANRFNKWPEDKLPAIIVISPGTADTPSRAGEGRYSAVWSISVTTVVAARDVVSGRRLANIYTGAVRAILLQKQSLGGFAAGTAWIGDRYDAIQDRNRTLAAGTWAGEVLVRDVVTSMAGPGEATPEPSYEDAEWPAVTSLEIEVDLKEDS